MANIYGKAFFDSEIVPIEAATLSVTSAAVLYGLSVYTVLPLCVTERGLGLFRLADHFQRLIDSTHIMGINTFAPAWDMHRFEAAVQETVMANAITRDVFVRITVHVTEPVPGTRSRGLATKLSIFLYDAQPILSPEGVRLKTSVWRRISDQAIPSRAKVNGAYVNSVLAKQDALDDGYDDCIFLDADGHVCELSAANIFIVRDGILITPGTANDILEGINRRTMLELAHDMGIETVERAVDLSELYIADEVFACGTSAFVASVREIDGRSIGDGTPGPITQRLREKHREVLHGEDANYHHWLRFIDGAK